ncbi:hypothetical protein Sta7437_3576 [Stanieria cyanosphaera PCC 7437]|uniref:Uncharacterized protein n=1 Tax=Stanieria cyanosphaera (strain ATCC 29371 / PCC 7437) TaxID=111780 RepID=K9XYH0_STAC7|nr:hypothetical protein [Stanieria cyanosphaera]AFZ37074.1 hypothetical protein Sta7437_3576 [Stanieria cyanosphaera PCC 7437]
MKIDNLRTESYRDRIRAIATVTWEDRDRPSQDIYFETTNEFASDIWCNPNAFLAACVIPAMRYGERRITLDAPICPALKDGLTNIMHCLVHWHKGDRRVIPIEAPLASDTDYVMAKPRAGCFFSGGIDSLAMVRNNRFNFAPEHSRSIKDGIFVYGILNGEDEEEPSFQYVLDAVSSIANDAEINLIPIYTNAYAHIRDLDPDFLFWKLEFQGSFLAAVAHSLSRRLTTVSMASTYDLAHLAPWGSHPLIDHHFSSSNLHIRHEDAALSRLAKTKLVAQWDVALRHLRVCNEKDSYREGNYNCGKCEKCVRTMTALLGLGLLEEVTTFKEKDVSKKLLIKTAHFNDTFGESSYRELIPLLAQIKRYDLVDGINIILNRYHEKDLKGVIKRIDRIFLKGRLFNLSKKLIYSVRKEIELGVAKRKLERVV